MEDREERRLGKSPEDIEEGVPHRYLGRPTSSMEKETSTGPTPYPNPKPKQPLAEPTPTPAPFISSSSESRSANSPRDQTITLHKESRRWHTQLSFLPFSKLHLEWVASNLTYPKLKPAIRSAGVAWVCVVLFVIPAFERVMGQASFVVLIGEFNRTCFM